MTAIALGLAMAHVCCIPSVMNLSKGETLPSVLSMRFSENSQLLVLPLWADARSYNFRRPYVVSVSAIGTSVATVPPRWGFEGVKPILS